jgi:hypothetical protein
MTRRWRLIAQIAVLGALILALPSTGSALSVAFVQLTPSGPSPAVLSIPAGMYPVWENTDTVAHTVTFAKGLCSFQVAPGQIGQCRIGWPAGQYEYTVDGTFQGSVVVDAAPPPHPDSHGRKSQAPDRPSAAALARHALLERVLSAAARVAPCASRRSGAA